MKVDTSYLKKLVEELDLELEKAESSDSPIGISLSDELQKEADIAKLVAISKAAGLCMGITQESTMLIGDLQKVVSSSFAAPKSSKNDLAESSLTGFLKTYKTGNDKN